MTNLVGGRVRDVNKFSRHKYCLYRDEEFVCFGKALVNTEASKNKFYVMIDLTGDTSPERIDFYKQAYLNVLYNFNVPVENILMITWNTLPQSMELLFEHTLTLRSNSKAGKTAFIHDVNQFLNTHIVSPMSKSNLLECSVILDITARGSVRDELSDRLVSFNGNTSKDDYLSNDEFYRVVDCLYSSNNVRDVTYILNSCYSAFKFGGLFFDFLNKKGYLTPNSNLLTAKPMLIYIYILVLLLETNPTGPDCLTDAAIFQHIEQNLLSLGLSYCIEFIAKFRDICERHRAAFNNFLRLQQSVPFKGDRMDDSVFSNGLLFMFDDINNLASYLLFHNQLGGPFKHLDMLKDLNQTLAQFNKSLSTHYLELVNTHLTNSQSNGETVNAFGIGHLDFAHGELDARFVTNLITESFNNIPNSFINNVNRKGVREGETEPIVLSELF